MAFIESCREKKEDGKCPTCSKGPIKVQLTFFVSLVVIDITYEGN